MAVTHKELSAGVLGGLRARGSSHRGRVTFQSEDRGHPGGEEGKGTPSQEVYASKCCYRQLSHGSQKASSDLVS